MSAYAYGRHLANRHTPLARGELARAMAAIDYETGEMRPSVNVTRSIRSAIEYGWLDEGSTQRCLIVPRSISGGHGGNRTAHVRCIQCQDYT